MRFRLAMTACVGAAVIAAGASAQTVLYDTLRIVDEGFMDAGAGHCIGGLNGPLREVADSQVAEDFDCPGTFSITEITIDIMSYNGTVPAEGIWLQFYAHDASRDKPMEEVSYELVVPREDFASVDEFQSELQFRGWRIRMVLPRGRVVLGEGRWWLDAQPLDIRTNGDWFWSIGSILLPPVGSKSHVRDGGKAHGNGYRGIWGSSTWIPHNFRGNIVLSRKIVGVREGCRADCDGNTTLDIRDFFCFQGKYAAGDMYADFDGNNVLDIRDFFAYQGEYAQGCR